MINNKNKYIIKNNNKSTLLLYQHLMAMCIYIIMMEFFILNIYK